MTHRTTTTIRLSRLALLFALVVGVATGCAASAPGGSAHGPDAGLVDSRTSATRSAGSEDFGPMEPSMDAEGFGGYETERASVRRSGDIRHESPDDESTVDSPSDHNGNRSPGGSSDPSGPVVPRRDFPETMVVQPRLITDAAGNATIRVDRMPDSITTWKVRAIGHSADGVFGEGSGTFRVFKEIFLNLQVPPILTEGDELWVPLTVMNYSAETITVDVTIQREAWVETDGEGRYRFSVEPNGSNRQYARITAVKAGSHALTVRARAGASLDAVQLPIQVEPRGIRRSVTRRISLTGSERRDIRFPRIAPADATEEDVMRFESNARRRVELTITPTTLSQLLLARRGLIQRPTGCLEQTLSTTLVDVEIARAFFALEGDEALAQLQQARQVLQYAYQRLLTYFDADSQRFGSYPGQYRWDYDGWLTAYALYTLKAMRGVGVTVDGDLIDKLDEQIALTVDSMSGPQRYFALWAYMQGRSATDSEVVVHREVRILLDRLAKQPASFLSTYELALMMNVWATKGDPLANASFDAIIGRFDFGSGDEVELPNMIGDAPGRRSLTWARGDVGNQEVVSLVLVALAQMGADEGEIMNRLVTGLLRHRMADGLWPTTFASAMAYRALASMEQLDRAAGTSSIAGRFNSTSFGPVQLGGDDNSWQPVQMAFDADSLNSLELVAQGLVEVQVTQHTWFPDISHFPSHAQAFDLRVKAGSQTLRQGETTDLTFSIARKPWAPGDNEFNEWWPGARFTPPAGATGNPVVVVIGVPTTMRVFEDSLEQLKSAGWIARYELTGREIRLYINGVPTDGLTGSVTLFAVNPGTVTAPASRAFEYYNPDGTGYAPPMTFTVSR